MIASLKSILLKKYQGTPINNDIKLKDKQSKMEVKLTGVPQGGLVFSVPSGGKSHIGAVKEKKDYKKSCDYLILVPYNDRLDAYFIELKTTLNPNDQGVPKEGCKQILCTIPVLKYLISMVDIHCGKNDKVNQYYAVIGKRESSKLDKQGVKPSRPKYARYKRKRFKIISHSPIVSLRQLK